MQTCWFIYVTGEMDLLSKMDPPRRNGFAVRQIRFASIEQANYNNSYSYIYGIKKIENVFSLNWTLIKFLLLFPFNVWRKIKGPEFPLVRLSLRGTIFQLCPISDPPSQIGCLGQLDPELFSELLSICLTSYLSYTDIGFAWLKDIY